MTCCAYWLSHAHFEKVTELHKQVINLPAPDEHMHISINASLFEQLVDSICAPSSTPKETIDYFHAIMRKSVSEAIDLACGQYSSLSQCQAKFPATIRAMQEQIPANSEHSEKPIASTSFLVPLIHIARRLDE